MSKYLEDVKSLLVDVLGLSGASASLAPSTPLLGSLPELDSMAVVNLIGALEEQFGIVVEDDEISASTFASVATLTEFVEQKQAG